MADEPRNRLSRRTILKRVGAGAAIAWTAPVIASVRVPAFAVGSGTCDACLATTVGHPPVTSHVVFNATNVCCDCISSHGGGLVGLVTCAFVTGDCLPIGGVQPGPCP